MAFKRTTLAVQRSYDYEKRSSSPPSSVGGRTDGPWTCRGAAAAARWRVPAEGSRRRCVGLVFALGQGAMTSLISRQQPAMTKVLARWARATRGRGAALWGDRGGAAAATWIFRGCAMRRGDVLARRRRGGRARAGDAAIRRLPKTRKGGEFPFSSLQVNYNYAAKKHVDGNNIGPSYIMSIGSHTGGALWTADQGVIQRGGRAASRIVRGDGVPARPRPRRGSIRGDGVAATPRPRRGYSVGSRRRRGCATWLFRGVVAATPRPRRG